jgi:phytanoyl-CoA hydroxylase
MSDKDNFHNLGYLVKKNFFPVSLISEVFNELINNNAEVQRQVLTHVDSGLVDKKNVAIENGNIKYLKNPQLYFKLASRLIHSSLFHLTEKLFENLYLDTIELHQKYPGTTETPPHQDNFYFCLKEGKALTAYIPLNDQSFENGALAVLPESHKFDLDHNPSKVPGFSSGVVLTNDQKDKSDYYSLKAGDLSLHHCNIVHFAPPNLSEIPRINIAMRFRSLDDTIDAKRFEKYKKFRDSSVRIT